VKVAVTQRKNDQLLSRWPQKELTTFKSGQAVTHRKRIVEKGKRRKKKTGKGGEKSVR